VKKRYAIPLAFLAVVGVGYWVYATPPSAPARVILTADEIVTMDPEQPTVDAVLIENGIITDVGALDQLSSSGEVEIRHLDGVLTPGLIEPHTHPIASALLGASLDISSFKYSTRAEIMAALKEAAGKTALTPWLVAYGWDPVALPGLTPPTREELDAISADRPIIILTQMLHDAYVNTAAVDAAGITLQGSLLHETIAIDSVVTKIPPPAPALTELLVRRQFAKYARNGFTTIGVTGAVGRHPDQIGLLKRISTDDSSPLRSFVYLVQRHLDRYVETENPDYALGGDLDFAVLGAKFWVDGSPFTGGAATAEPYDQNTFVNDYLSISPAFKDNILNTAEDLEQRLSDLHQAGYQIALHVQGERAVDAALDAIERLQDAYPMPQLSHRLEHNALITQEQMARAARLNVSLGFFIDHISYYGHVLPNFFGADRMTRYMPVNSAFESGALVTLHGDHPATPIDPINTLRTATTRQSYRGDTVSGLSEAVTAYQAFQAMTINAATQLGLQDALGSIAIGKQADFALFTRNPVTGDLNSIAVKGTWKDGQPVDQRNVSWLKPGLVFSTIGRLLGLSGS
jgi:predicted amidohydrolase YtcJ